MSSVILTPGHEAARADALVASFDDLPTLPDVLVRIWQIVDDPDASARDLESAVSLDAALAAKVLRLANSPFYGRRTPAASVQTAITALGFDTIRNLAVCLTVARSLGQGSGEERVLDRHGLWRHGVAVGVLARALCRDVGLPGREEAFTSGLLHDIGKYVLSIGRPRAYTAIVELVRERGLPLRMAEREEIGADHADLGAAFARHWGFPDSMVSAIGGHHGVEDQPTLATVIGVADALAHELAPCVVLPGVDPGPVPPAGLAALGVDRNWLDERSDAWAAEIAAAQDFMDLV